MRLALESDPNIHLVRSYGAGLITIGEESLSRPCAVSPQTLLRDWEAISIATMTAPQVDKLLGVGATIVLLGEGETQQLPSAEIRKLCRLRGIALECMNLGAACRTYNILANEQRSVIAGLFP
jgi:uncharacterized protein